MACAWTGKNILQRCRKILVARVKDRSLLARGTETFYIGNYVRRLLGRENQRGHGRMRIGEPDDQTPRRGRRHVGDGSKIRRDGKPRSRPLIGRNHMTGTAVVEGEIAAAADATRHIRHLYNPSDAQTRRRFGWLIDNGPRRRLCRSQCGRREKDGLRRHNILLNSRSRRRARIGAVTIIAGEYEC